MNQAAVRCMLIRGGTSKGVYLLAGDLPPARDARDAMLLAAASFTASRQRMK